VEVRRRRPRKRSSRIARTSQAHWQRSSHHAPRIQHNHRCHECLSTQRRHAQAPKSTLRKRVTFAIRADAYSPRPTNVLRRHRFRIQATLLDHRRRDLPRLCLLQHRPHQRHLRPHSKNPRPGINPDTPVFDRYQLAIVTIGSLFVYFAALLRSWAESYLHSSIVHDAAIHSDQLVAEGPHRYVRNPLYLGNDLLAIGLGVLTSRLGFVVMVVGMFIVTYRLILREEAGLLATQGESYRRYFNAVPRLWPSLRPRIASGGAKPNWRDGLTGEIFMWSIAIGMTAFVVTQRIWMFWLVMGVGFAIYFLQAYLRKRPATP
jgi:hypothetical protein